MNSVLLRPFDWLSFGPPRPMNAGDLHRRSTDFPPTPTAFQGILRTALLRAAGVDLQSRTSAAQKVCAALVGTPDELPPGWQLTGPFATEVVEREGERIARPWVPAPRFLFQKPGSDIPVHARPVRSPSVESGPAALNDASPQVEPLLLGRPELDATEAFGGWLSPRGLLRALSGDVAGLAWDAADHCPVLPPFVKRHALPGLAIDANSGTAEDGMLFLGEVLYFSGGSGLGAWLSASFPQEIPADALTRGDLVSCGWRSRPAVLERLPRLDDAWQRMEEGRHLPEAEIASDQAFFLVALTPVRCAAGASPEAAVQAQLQAHATVPPGVEVRVLASLTGPRRVIGGLEAASGRPRPNRSYWDAGAAWLFVLRGGTGADRAAALRALHGTHPLGPRNEAAFGYGHTVVGVGPRLGEVGGFANAGRSLEG